MLHGPATSSTPPYRSLPVSPHAAQAFLPLWRAKLRVPLAASGQRSILPGQVDGKQSTDYTSRSSAAGHQHSSWTPGPTSWAMGTEVTYYRRRLGGELPMGSETPVWKAYGAGIKCTVCVLTQLILSLNN